jgi:hypothetical protein
VKVLAKWERMGQMNWPEATAVTGPTLGPSDTLILAAGFEPRILGLLDAAVAAGSRSFEVVAINYTPADASNRYADVIARCEQAGASHRVVPYDRVDPGGIADQVLSQIAAGRSVHLDITGMTHLLTVQMVVGLLESAGSSFSVWYTEADEYPPSRQDIENKLPNPDDPMALAMFLSSGVLELCVVPELSSVEMQGQPMHVVAFPTWNPMQLATLCSDVHASAFTLFHGRPPRPDLEWRLDAIERLNRTDSIKSRDDIVVSTLDYRETLRALLHLYSSHARREKIVVAPTGSKMQTVAVAIFRSWFPDTQIVYPPPAEYESKRYTHGVRALWRLPLNTFAISAEGASPPVD